MSMITPVLNTMIPRHVYLDPETGKEWLYFEYDGTFMEFKRLPMVVRKGEKFYVKTGHNSDTFNVSYRETPQSDIVFKVGR